MGDGRTRVHNAGDTRESRANGVKEGRNEFLLGAPEQSTRGRRAEGRKERPGAEGGGVGYEGRRRRVSP